MREIKFRAWNGEQMLHDARSYSSNDEALYVSFNGQVAYLDDDGGCDDPECCGGRMYYMQKIEFFILMQFTGLHDKNGKEMWEGDIVRITWLNYANKQESIIRDIKWNGNGYGNVFDEGNSPKYAIEVIGNIYQNPELLSK